jgi:small-conductance mechanosensitive channel
LLLVGTNPSWGIPLWEGFVAGFLMTFVIQIITLACLIPFVGIYLYWIWANAFCDWFLGVTHLETLDILRWIPLVFCGIFGAIICVVFSIFALVAIGIIVSAIISR